jgi:hypothetical protein
MRLAPPANPSPKSKTPMRDNPHNFHNGPPIGQQFFPRRYHLRKRSRERGAGLRQMRQPSRAILFALHL